MEHQLSHKKTRSRFKKMCTDADINYCRALKSSAGRGKPAGQHNINQAEDLQVVFAAAMETSANAAEESIHTEIDNTLKSSDTGGR